MQKEEKKFEKSKLISTLVWHNKQNWIIKYKLNKGGKS